MQPLVIILIMLLAFLGLGLLFNRSIKKHDANMKTKKKKKGKYKQLPLSKRPGK
jgi:hypothetical protein